MSNSYDQIMEFYHLLNRGVDKRNIFSDDADRFRFVHDLFEFNDTRNARYNNHRPSNQLFDIRCQTVDLTGKKSNPAPPPRQPRKLLVRIHFFCLMPNHYHLLVSPLIEDGIPRFMKKLNMGYAKYFNKKYRRDGALFQGKYKKVHIARDAHFLWIPYYIHFNPLDLYMPEWRKQRVRGSRKALEYLESYRWSSHLDYLGKKNFPSVTHRDFFLESFGGGKGYANSITSYLGKLDVSKIKEATLE